MEPAAQLLKPSLRRDSRVRINVRGYTTFYRDEQTSALRVTIAIEVWRHPRTGMSMSDLHRDRVARDLRERLIYTAFY
jgi:hypothetical protein